MTVVLLLHNQFSSLGSSFLEVALAKTRPVGFLASFPLVDCAPSGSCPGGTRRLVPFCVCFTRCGASGDDPSAQEQRSGVVGSVATDCGGLGGWGVPCHWAAPELGNPIPLLVCRQ